MTFEGGETAGRRRSWFGRRLRVAIAVVAAVAAVPVYWLLIDGRGTQGLWHVVDGMCRPMMRWTGHPVPCLEVSPAGGWALLHAPFDGSQFLVVPLARITGIEDSASRSAEARDLWSVAWEHRRLVDARAGRALRPEEIALAVNSQSSRTQSHYHIHVDCLKPAARRRFAEELPKIGPDWRELRPISWSAPYRGPPYRRGDAAPRAARPPDRTRVEADAGCLRGPVDRPVRHRRGDAGQPDLHRRRDLRPSRRRGRSRRRTDRSQMPSELRRQGSSAAANRPSG